MALKGFFVVGTDTGVGKTAVAAALVYLMSERGIRTAPVKPVQTGAGRSEPGDLEICLQTAGIQPDSDELRLMNPYRFRFPGSPHLAAELEKTRIDLDLLEKSCRQLALRYQALVVEGAGGLMVPLTRETTFPALASRLDLPLVVVARSGLGTINHCLLTVAAARQAGLRVSAVALNRPGPCPLDRVQEKIERDNRLIISSLAQVEVWKALPHIPGAGEKPVPTRELAAHLARAGADRLIETLSR